MKVTATSNPGIRERSLQAPRRAVLEAAAGALHPFTVEQLFHLVRAVRPTIGRSTVYRSVAWLERKGEIRRVALPSGRFVFSHCTSPVTALAECPHCGAVRSFDAGDLEYRAHCISKLLGFSLTNASWTSSAECSSFPTESCR